MEMDISLEVSSSYEWHVRLKNDGLTFINLFVWCFTVTSFTQLTKIYLYFWNFKPLLGVNYLMLWICYFLYLVEILQYF